MKFKTKTVEELETLPFDDIAYIILQEKGKKMKINDIFRIICDTLNLGESAFENQIGDFFALLATEKRFIQLEKGDAGASPARQLEATFYISRFCVSKIDKCVRRVKQDCLQAYFRAKHLVHSTIRVAHWGFRGSAPRRGGRQRLQALPRS